MRILFVTDLCHPGVGGVQTFVAGLCDAWMARGHRVLVVNAPLHGSPAGGAHVVAQLPLSRPASVDEQRGMALALREIALQHDVEVVLLATAGLAVYASAFQCPVVAVVHGKDLTEPWQLTPGRDATAAIADGLRLCSTVVAVSGATSAVVRQIAGLPCHVVEPGFDAAFFVPGPSCRPTFAVAPDAFVVGTVARLVDRKGHATVIDAISRCHARQRIVYLVAGDGPQRAQLEREAAAAGVDARFLGVVSAVRVRDLYRSIDVHVLFPTPHLTDIEGYGLAILEAAGCCCPTLAARVGGVPEAMHDDRPPRAGLLLEPRGTDALAAALDALADAPARRERLAQDAYRRALVHGGHARCADELERLLT
jgi:glycosyltransferase involved in cell wall biosynthesis